MKVSVNDEQVFVLSETQKKVIKNDIQEEIFDEDMKRRLKYILMEKYEKCFERLQAEWMPKLSSRGISSIPLDKEQFAELIFSQPDYENRSQRTQKL